MAVVVPGTHTGFNLNSYKRGADGATYQKMKAIPKIEDYGMRLYGTGNVRKWARMTGDTLSSTATGTGLNYQTFIASPVTVAAGGNYVAMAWARNEQAQIDIDLKSGGTGQIEEALAEASDTAVLANAASNTQIISQASVDAPMWRQAVGRLMANTNGVASPGQRQIYVLFSPTQYPNVSAIPEFNNAQYRGDKENPFVKGFFTTAGGVVADYTTAIYQDANGWHNPLFIEEAYIIGWNTRTDVDFLQDELQYRLIAYNNFGSNVQHDLRAVVMRTTASAL
jgi:hypothetical protein